MEKNERSLKSLIEERKEEIQVRTERLKERMNQEFQEIKGDIESRPPKRREMKRYIGRLKSMMIAKREIEEYSFFSEIHKTKLELEKSLEKKNKSSLRYSIAAGGVSLIALSFWAYISYSNLSLSFEETLTTKHPNKGSMQQEEFYKNRSRFIPKKGDDGLYSPPQIKPWMTTDPLSEYLESLGWTQDLMTSEEFNIEELGLTALTTEEVLLSKIEEETRKEYKEKNEKGINLIENASNSSIGVYTYNPDDKDNSTLWGIIENKYGYYSLPRLRVILELNPGLDPRKLRRGLEINLPSSTEYLNQLVQQGLQGKEERKNEE